MVLYEFAHCHTTASATYSKAIISLISDLRRWVPRVPGVQEGSTSAECF